MYRLRDQRGRGWGERDQGAMTHSGRTGDRDFELGGRARFGFDNMDAFAVIGDRG
jgi:hypothetical protein